MKTNKLKINFLNLLMLNGNKQTSEKLLIKISKNFQKKFNKKNFIELFKNGIINSSPILFFKNIKRKRKKTVEFPFLIKPRLRIFYGTKFMLKNCVYKNNISFYLTFKEELSGSLKKKSVSVKEKKNLHKEAVLKKKFANYRWF